MKPQLEHTIALMGVLRLKPPLGVGEAGRAQVERLGSLDGAREHRDSVQGASAHDAAVFGVLAGPVTLLLSFAPRTIAERVQLGPELLVLPLQLRDLERERMTVVPVRHEGVE